MEYKNNGCKECEFVPDVMYHVRCHRRVCRSRSANTMEAREFQPVEGARRGPLPHVGSVHRYALSLTDRHVVVLANGYFIF